MRRVTLAVVALAALAPGCRPEPAPAPPVAERRVELEFGVHRVSVVVPAGWQAIDLGGSYRFEDGRSRFTLEDAGPVSGDAIRGDLERARALAWSGQQRDAREVLSRIPLREAVVDERLWEAVAEPWSRLLQLGSSDESPGTFDEAFTAVLFELIELRDRGLDELVEAALPRAGHDDRRDVARREHVSIDGRDAVLIDTWDRLSHTMPARLAFVVDRGHLLVARTGSGDQVTMRPAFDSLVASLEFRATPATRPGTA